MKILSRACLIVCASCVIAITVRDEPRQLQVPTEEDDYSEFDLEQFGVEDDEEPDEQEAKEEAERLEEPSNRALEPEAEMLPANYRGVKPPGVDHMEMTGYAGKKKPKPRSKLAYRFVEE
ncbi:hypothetical protein TSAR_005967 [Trichomalopsis sarcophagae]|uniref:Uncharacterized protein n=1 Tax=Trichomalopsis sarcophagae TaxID=543379 RepID=A0A232EIK0_9HYME|nr:hypothetical protein TSAR_005967 [Trichomalopsis sarcophagae]